jgi:hypothetical protein
MVKTTLFKLTLFISTHYLAYNILAKYAHSNGQNNAIQANAIVYPLTILLIIFWHNSFQFERTFV